MKEKKNICTGCAAAEADGRFVRHPESADGEAVVTAYPMFPGIEIAYCDIHAHECRLEHTGSPAHAHQPLPRGAA